MHLSRAAIVFIAVTFGQFAPGAASAQEPGENAAPHIGRIVIVGNTITRDDVIRNAINLYPGQTLRFADLTEAERRLTCLGIFESDPKRGGPPTVTTIASDDRDFQDILVRVKEAPATGSVKFGIGFTGKGRLTLRVDLDERNFDPCRLPTSFADLAEGRAFRGGGRHLRLRFTLGAR